MVGDSLCGWYQNVVWSLGSSRLRISSHHAGKTISANLRVEPSEECDASVPR